MEGEEEGEGEEEVQEAADAGGVARKRKRVGAGEDAAEEEEEAEGVYGKALLGEDGEDGRYDGIAEEAVAEVMRWLEAEIIADNAAAALPPPEGAGFVTINGNEESCGPSFSAAESTVMASVDTRAGAPPPPPVPWPWPEPEPEPDPVLPAPGVGVDVDVEMGMGMGGAGEPADEEWLARLLTCGALLEGGALLT